MTDPTASDAPPDRPSVLEPLAEWLRHGTPPLRPGPDPGPPGDGPGDRMTAFSELARALSHWLDGWSTACLPDFIEGTRLNQSRPDLLVTFPLRGGFGYGGGVTDADATAVLAHSTWRSQVVLPSPRADGTLHYRYRVTGGFSGEVVGRTSVVAHTTRTAAVADHRTSTPFLTAEWARTRDAGARASNAVTGPQRLAARGSVVVESSIPVRRGAAPEIAVALSTELLVYDATIDFQVGGPNELRMGGVTAGAGCLDYRYVPDEFEAMISRLRLRPALDVDEDEDGAPGADRP